MSDDHIDTGLLALAPSSGVAQPVEQQAVNLPVVGSNPTPGAIVPVPPANMPVGWTIQKTAALIRDLAHNMYEVPFILKTHGVSVAQYEALQKNEFFERTLAAMTVEWNSIGNTQKRLALEAAIALEDALPTVAARLSKATEPLAGVVELAKLLAKMSGVGEVAQNAAPTERFKITINLGADVQRFEKQRPTLTVQSIPEGQGAEPPIQALIDGS